MARLKGVDFKEDVLGVSSSTVKVTGTRISGALNEPCMDPLVPSDPEVSLLPGSASFKCLEPINSSVTHFFSGASFNTERKRSYVDSVVAKLVDRVVQEGRHLEFKLISLMPFF